jgi:arabinoxylan arabinofuranohydrolase
MEMSSPVYTATKNPLLPNLGVCDPHIHIFDGRAYLYASHDTSPANQDWIMRDWQIWSSPDLVHWNLESTLRPEDTYIGASSRCWAIDAAQRNGKTFLYHSNGDYDTGVAVADNPGGPFRAALDRPLLPHNLTDTHQYDPTAYVDEDGTPYLIWGSYQGSGYNIARLDPSMTALAEAPSSIVIHGKPSQDDKSFLHRRGDTYYLSWGSFYATSQNIRGPYTYRGNIGVSHDHGSFFEWNGQCFNAFTVFDRSCFFRGTGLCYIHYRADGSMAADPLITQCGVGHYDASWNEIKAVWFMATNGIEKRENHWSRFEVSLRNSDWLQFPRVRSLPANATLALWCVAGGTEPVKIEVRAGSAAGEIIGSTEIKGSCTWGYWAYRTHELQLSQPAGEVDLCFCVSGSEGTELLRFEYFKVLA